MKIGSLLFSIFLLISGSSISAQEDQKYYLPEIYDLVDRQPEFPGGQIELLKYLSSNIDYLEVDERNRIEGTVIARFVLYEDGTIHDVQIIRSISATIDAETIRVIQEMPDWEPGYQSGKPAKVYFTLPVRFKLWL